jgi:hypothetical protein
MGEVGEAEVDLLRRGRAKVGAYGMPNLGGALPVALLQPTYLPHFGDSIPLNF